MPKVLSAEQIAQYERDGAIAPIPMMSCEDAKALRTRSEELESVIDGELQSRFRIKRTCRSRGLRSDAPSGAAGCGRGPDRAGHRGLGIERLHQKAHDPRFVSWHQDSTYYGLESPESITAWIAFSDGTHETGCGRILPGSHKGPAVPRDVKTYAEDNLLSRGQAIENIDDTRVVELELRAGEMLIHHNKTVHSSEPYLSDQARIGFAVHIAPPQVRQAQFDDATAVVVRGSDRFGHWQSEPTPRGDMDSNRLAALDHAWGQYRRAMKAPYGQ